MFSWHLPSCEPLAHRRPWALKQQGPSSSLVCSPPHTHTRPSKHLLIRPHVDPWSLTANPSPRSHRRFRALPGLGGFPLKRKPETVSPAPTSALHAHERTVGDEPHGGHPPVPVLCRTSVCVCRGAAVTGDTETTDPSASACGFMTRWLIQGYDVCAA